MHALLCEVPDGDSILDSQATVTTKHPTVPELGAGSVSLDMFLIIVSTKTITCKTNLGHNSGWLQAICSCFLQTLCQNILEGTLHELVVLGPEVNKIKLTIGKNNSNTYL